MVNLLSTAAFYAEQPDQAALFQGDILSAEKLNIKEQGVSGSPDYWLIISKSCDLQFRIGAQLKVKNALISMLPLVPLTTHFQLRTRDFRRLVERARAKVILIAIWNIFEKLNVPKQIEALVKDQISRFMFLPADGVILKEPAVIDFEWVVQENAVTEEQVKGILAAKVLELKSPVREKIAQRFGLHYSQIGVDDDEFRAKPYTDLLKKTYAGRIQ